MNCSKLFNYFLIITLTCSCSNTTDDYKYYDLLDKQLVQSTKIVQQGANIYIMRLRQMTADPLTAEKASIWLSKAESVDLPSRKLINYIDLLKAKLDSSGKVYELEKLFQELKDLQDTSLNIDPEVRKYMHNEINLLTSVDSTEGSKQSFLNIFFMANSDKAKRSLLSKFQNSVAIVENIISTYCCYQIGTAGGGYIVEEPIVEQNVTHLRRGEKLMLTAGVGTFYRRFRPNVFINGKKIEIGENSKFKYSMEVSGNSGKNSIPVLIEYYDWNDEKKQKTFEVEYFIDN